MKSYWAGFENMHLFPWTKLRWLQLQNQIVNYSKPNSNNLEWQNLSDSKSDEKFKIDWSWNFIKLQFWLSFTNFWSKSTYFWSFYVDHLFHRVSFIILHTFIIQVVHLIFKLHRVYFYCLFQTDFPLLYKHFRSFDQILHAP